MPRTTRSKKNTFLSLCSTISTQAVTDLRQLAVDNGLNLPSTATKKQLAEALAPIFDLPTLNLPVQVIDETHSDSSQYICPILNTFFCFPVIASDENTYELDTYLRFSGISPLTKAEFTCPPIPSRTIRNDTESFCKAHGLDVVRLKQRGEELQQMYKDMFVLDNDQQQRRQSQAEEKEDFDDDYDPPSSPIPTRLDYLLRYYVSSDEEDYSESDDQNLAQMYAEEDYFIDDEAADMECLCGETYFVIARDNVYITSGSVFGESSLAQKLHDRGYVVFKMIFKDWYQDLPILLYLNANTHSLILSTQYRTRDFEIEELMDGRISVTPIDQDPTTTTTYYENVEALLQAYPSLAKNTN